MEAKIQVVGRDRPFIADGALGDPIRLLSTRCLDCDVSMFPPQSACGRCGGQAVEDAPVGPRGKIWTYTTQTFRPPSPPYGVDDSAETFQSYGVAMVEFEGGLLVHGRLLTDQNAALAIGQTVEAVALQLEGDGGALLETYAFRLISEGEVQ